MLLVGIVDPDKLALLQGGVLAAQGCNRRIKFWILRVPLAGVPEYLLRLEQGGGARLRRVSHFHSVVDQWSSIEREHQHGRGQRTRKSIAGGGAQFVMVIA